jgi:phosphatidylglycerol:prolipoprotein diacylglycerol transferase
MCSELFHIPYRIGGVPIFGVGVLLAIWLIASAATVFGLIRRGGTITEIIGALPVLLLLGAAILFLPRVFPDGLPVRGYGVMLLVGITSGVGLAMYRARQGGLNPEIILSLAIWLVVSGVIGARLFYVTEYWDESFAGRSVRDTFLEVINIPEGGLVIYGGLVGAAVGFTIFVLKHRLPLLAMADLIAPSMAIGLAFGRIGCFLNGCCYGGQTDLPWHVTFPKFSSRFESANSTDLQHYSPPYADQASRGEMHGFRMNSQGDQPAVITHVDPDSPAAGAGLKVGDSIAAINGDIIHSLVDAKFRMFDAFKSQSPIHLTLRDGRSISVPAATIPERSRPVHPTQLYSAIDGAILGWLLWTFYPLRRHDGEAIALLLTVHPITRFLLEVIRTDEPAVFGTGMTISQNVSLVLLACGTALWWHLSREPTGVLWPLTIASDRSERAAVVHSG